MMGSDWPRKLWKDRGRGAGRAEKVGEVATGVTEETDVKTSSQRE